MEIDFDFSVCDISIPFVMYVSTDIGGIQHELIVSSRDRVVVVFVVAMEFVLLCVHTCIVVVIVSSR